MACVIQRLSHARHLEVRCSPALSFTRYQSKHHSRAILGPKLPMVVDLGQSEAHGIRSLVINRIGKEHVRHCYKLYEKYAQCGHDFGCNEFPNIDTYEKAIFREGDREGVFGVFDGDTDKMAGIISLYPTPMCRSEIPLFAGSCTMATKMDLQLEIVLVRMACQMASHLGFCGTITRVASTNHTKANMWQRVFGAVLNGNIPQGVNMKGSGFVEDMVGLADFHFTGLSSIVESISDPKNTPSVIAPPLPSAIKPDSLESDLPGVVVSIPGEGRGLLQKANADQKFQIEEQIYYSAGKGKEYGLDEFTPDGVFNRRLFQKSLTLALVNVNNELKGYMIVGPSATCRDYNAANLHVYCCSTAGDTEIETELFKYAILIAKDNGYTGVLTDVYQTDTKKLLLLRKMGFLHTATLPYCGYIKDIGFTDAHLMYRRSCPWVVNDAKLRIASEV